MKKLAYATMFALVALPVAIAFAQEGPGGGGPGARGLGHRMRPGRELRGDLLLNMFDADKDGKVTHQEWINVFKKIDGDGDGVITKDEIEASRQKMREEAGKRMFEKFDADGSGTIDKDEFPGADARFDMIDANGDGQIAPEELSEAAKKLREIRNKRWEERRGKQSGANPD